uniref:HAP2-like protein n=1 Tax=Andalucia godoyi TaxID=505711 RepID=A0A0K0VK76_ANDGO|nr:HAP2-like protein [Andalucia godoyi]|eukprot:ANDGO_06755.mRNA.1 Protein HAPLESS 2-B
MARTVLVALLSVVMTVHFVQRALGDLIAASQLEQCVRDGSNPDDDAMDCQQKFTVALTLQSGQAATQSLVAVMKSARDSQGRNYTLASPVKISVSRTSSYLSYPITYRQTFNAAPYEQVIKLGAFGCTDSGGASSPSCGWAQDSNGNNIPDSQGFCCSCTLMDAVNSQRTRASLSCLTGFLTSYQSAHCLRYDTLWYAAYEIGDPTLFFNVNVAVEWKETAANGTVSARKETLVVSPVGTVRSLTDKSIRVRLVGNFESFKSRLSLSGKYYFVPSSPVSNDRVMYGFKNSMLIDKSLVSFSGSECNKIGVSFVAFRYDQGNQCYGTVGSCLQNQLEDYHKADLEKSVKGLVGSYFLSNFGEFSIQAYASSPAAADADKQFPQESAEEHSLDKYAALRHATLSDDISNSLPPRHPGMRVLSSPPRWHLNSVTVSLFRKQEYTDTTLIALTIDAASIKYVMNRSNGKIISATIKDFSAFSKNGLLVVICSNTGYIVSDYEVTVDDCSSGILPVLAKQISIAPQGTAGVDFAIQAEVDTTKLNTCRLRLWDLLGQILDERKINFTTTAVQEDLGAQGGASGTADRSATGSDGASGSQCDCFVLNIICHIQVGCGTNDTFLSFFYMLLLLILIAFIAKYLIVRLLTSSSSSSKKKKKKRNSRDDDDDDDDRKSASTDKRVQRKRRARKRQHEGIAESLEPRALPDLRKKGPQLRAASPPLHPSPGQASVRTTSAAGVRASAVTQKKKTQDGDSREHAASMGYLNMNLEKLPNQAVQSLTSQLLESSLSHPGRTFSLYGSLAKRPTKGYVFSVPDAFTSQESSWDSKKRRYVPLSSPLPLGEFSLLLDDQSIFGSLPLYPVLNKFPLVVSSLQGSV